MWCMLCPSKSSAYLSIEKQWVPLWEKGKNNIFNNYLPHIVWSVLNIDNISLYCYSLINIK